jgi:hypothetical protein
MQLSCYCYDIHSSLYYLHSMWPGDYVLIPFSLPSALCLFLPAGWSDAHATVPLLYLHSLGRCSTGLDTLLQEVVPWMWDFVHSMSVSVP